MSDQLVASFMKALSGTKTSYVCCADQVSAKNFVVLLLRQLTVRSIWYLDPVVHIVGMDMPVFKLEPYSNPTAKNPLALSDFGKIKGGHGFHLYTHSCAITLEHTDAISIGSRNLQIPQWSKRPCVKIDVLKMSRMVTNSTDDFVASVMNNQLVVHRDRGGLFGNSSHHAYGFQIPILDYPEDQEVKEEKPLSPQEELARITEKLYDVRHKKATHDPRVLLKRYKELTGRDQPGFYA